MSRLSWFRTRRRRPVPPTWRTNLHLESFEARDMLSVTASLSDGLLSVVGNAAGDGPLTPLRCVRGSAA